MLQPRSLPTGPNGADLQEQRASSKYLSLRYRREYHNRVQKQPVFHTLNSASKMARFAGFSTTLFRGVFSYTNQNRARPLPPAGPITLGVPDLTRRTCSPPAASYSL